VGDSAGRSLARSEIEGPIHVSDAGRIWIGGIVGAQVRKGEEIVKPGTVVRMSDALKQEMLARGSHNHIKEFGDCVGIVIGPVNFGKRVGPEIDVRWQPSNLRYMYNPAGLVEVE
jgi:hypothetical protein